MFTKHTVLWVIFTLHVVVAVDTNYFKCYRDLCRRGQQYCVEERQRCYHCADVAHLCNTTDISRDCDGYCNHVKLEEVAKKKDKTFSDITEVTSKLHNEQRISAKMKMEITQLKTQLIQLRESRTALLVADRGNKSHKAEHEDVVKQNAWFKATLIGVGAVCGVLVVVVIILAGVLRFRCSQKQDNPDEAKSQLPPVPEKKKMVYQMPEQLSPLLQGSGEYVVIGTNSNIVSLDGANISRASRPKMHSSCIGNMNRTNCDAMPEYKAYLDSGQC